MILELDFTDETPIYMQIRNQIVMGIADGRLSAGERLPTLRSLANEAGINMMTANKAYALLKQEGYITSDRRSGAAVCGGKTGGDISEKVLNGLKMLAAEAKLSGVSKQSFLNSCAEIYDRLEAGK